MTGKRVLLIGPDRPVRAAIEGALLQAGHEVEARNDQERPRDDARPEIVLCLTGLVDDEEGVDVGWLRERYPSARHVLVGSAEGMQDDPSVRCLSWPVDMEALRQALRE